MKKCAKLLGLSERDLRDTGMAGSRGAKVTLEWLKHTYMDNMTSTDERTAKRSARAYALYVFGCTLFSDTSGNRAQLSWMEFMSNMSSFRKYAWGAATLAYLYRRLGQAAKAEHRSMSGCLTLLEVSFGYPKIYQFYYHFNYMYLIEIVDIGLDL